MTTNALIEVNDLHKQFRVGKTGLFSRGEISLNAIDGVGFSIDQGEILALVGESGCGKSTLALTLMGLEQPTSGTIRIGGKDVTSISRRETKALRQKIQMIFQDPYESLSPLMTIAQIVAEPLEVHGVTQNRTEREDRVTRALEDVGLKPAHIFKDRFPHELSGGQRQRVVIAGALVLEPQILIADEPVSMLDVSIRADILNLLADLRAQRGISVLYITHDLSTVPYIADRVAVMYLGRIVEIGQTDDVLRNPQHPYTKALISVVPTSNPRDRGPRSILSGETPNPINLPSGCRFHPRCPVAISRCSSIDPELRKKADRPHLVACILD